MKKIITINSQEVRFYILQVFDEKLGHINEHILAVDITNVYYESESVLETIRFVKKEFPALKPVYYRVSADNNNTVYISIIGKSAEKHAVTEVNATSEDCKKYTLTMNAHCANY